VKAGELRKEKGEIGRIIGERERQREAERGRERE
jgi:hypothetical protein